MADALHTTRLLRRMAGGDAQAESELLPLVYSQLHELARALMAGERRHHTLQPTALVHEAWLRMRGGEEPTASDRAQFIGVAAKAMRRVLIDHARRRNAEKRNGGLAKEPLDAAIDLYTENGPDLLDLDQALQRLEALDPQLVRIIELRFFGGGTNDEAAVALGVSTRTVERGWKTAQAWLRAEIGEQGG
jgi:RNA polymerase sigma factor (TIGR02999 family)